MQRSTKALDEMEQTLHWSASLGVGLLLGILNWFFWRGQTRRLLSQTKTRWGLLGLLSLLKLAVIGLLLWFLLVQKQVDPVFFLAGFTVVVIAILLKGFVGNAHEKK